MRTFLLSSAVALTVASAVNAADCNPSYDVPGSTVCYTNCNIAAGKKYGVENWTMDHTSPYFIESLALMCDRTGSKYGSFMASAGMCMAGCSGDDPELFNAEWAGACAWWAEHKSDTCAVVTTTVAPTTTVVPTTTTTTTQSTTTTTTTKSSTTTTKSTTTSASATPTSGSGDCNPSYDVAGSTECFTNCNIAAGKKYGVPNWTMDHTSPNFIESLTLMCDRSGASYGSFMASAGMCMAGCTGDDPELFNTEWAAACAWWANHKTDTCDAGTTVTTTKTTTKSTTTTVPTTTTTTTVPTTTTTTKASTTTTKISTTTKATATASPTSGSGSGECNPSYNVAGSTTCFTNCNVAAGKKYGVPNWTMDHTSPNFIESLTLMCDRSGSNYGSFMATAGMCMAGCTGDDPELFNTEWAGACAWWASHKSDTCSGSGSTGGSGSSSTGSGSTTTAVVVPTTTTTSGGSTPTSGTGSGSGSESGSGSGECNPSYNVAGSTTCFTNCNVEAGKKYGVPNWTMDHTSPNFIESLTLMCDKSGSNYGSFMATAGMCMAGCSGDDPELFNTEWAGACAWWASHKSDTCAGSTGGSSTDDGSATTTTGATATTATDGSTPTGTGNGDGTCNPSYNVAGSTTCFTNCNVEAGKKYGVPNWTMDHTSINFIGSLALMCDKSGSNYGSFMATAGMCMAGCTGDDPELFNTEWAGACAWYDAHKNDQCSSTNVTATTTADGGSPTSTGAPSVVTVTKTKTCTKTKTVTKTKSASNCSPTCTSGHYGLGRGKGYAGACCHDQSDCWESCIKGKCNGPSQSSCKPGYLRKRRGNGPKNACCETQRDCKESCIKGRCN